MWFIFSVPGFVGISLIRRDSYSFGFKYLSKSIMEEEIITQSRSSFFRSTQQFHFALWPDVLLPKSDNCSSHNFNSFCRFQI